MCATDQIRKPHKTGCRVTLATGPGPVEGFGLRIETESELASARPAISSQKATGMAISGIAACHGSAYQSAIRGRGWRPR